MSILDEIYYQEDLIQERKATEAREHRERWIEATREFCDALNSWLSSDDQVLLEVAIESFNDSHYKPAAVFMWRGHSCRLTYSGSFSWWLSVDQRDHQLISPTDPHFGQGRTLLTKQLATILARYRKAAD